MHRNFGVYTLQFVQSCIIGKQPTPIALTLIPTNLVHTPNIPLCMNSNRLLEDATNNSMLIAVSRVVLARILFSMCHTLYVQYACNVAQLACMCA